MQYHPKSAGELKSAVTAPPPTAPMTLAMFENPGTVEFATNRSMLEPAGMMKFARPPLSEISSNSYVPPSGPMTVRRISALMGCFK